MYCVLCINDGLLGSAYIHNSVPLHSPEVRANLVSIQSVSAHLKMLAHL